MKDKLVESSLKNCKTDCFKDILIYLLFMVKLGKTRKETRSNTDK